ncbi:hypothetical protein GQ53DRAFT_39350 [Thozetella sp. PMI_491]|nr:hypothetical protein GQ53DRAFT_39350 [Thozetella sp. PMI_491]
MDMTGQLRKRSRSVRGIPCSVRSGSPLCFSGSAARISACRSVQTCQAKSACLVLLVSLTRAFRGVPCSRPWPTMPMCNTPQACKTWKHAWNCGERHLLHIGVNGGWCDLPGPTSACWCPPSHVPLPARTTMCQLLPQCVFLVQGRHQYYPELPHRGRLRLVSERHYVHRTRLCREGLQEGSPRNTHFGYS